MIYHRQQRWFGSKTNKYDSGTSYVASGVISTVPALLKGFNGFNSGPAQWLMLFNTIAVPADGQGCQKIFYIPATAGFVFDFGAGDESSYFNTGLCWANSTTSPTKTLGATNVVLKAGYEY